MKAQIIKTIKNSYNKNVRKEVVKSLLYEEQNTKVVDYKIINQIFSYVLSELNWTLVKSTQDWDNTPLDIMKTCFPNIEKTKWYNEQILTTKKTIELEQRDSQ